MECRPRLINGDEMEEARKFNQYLKVSDAARLLKVSCNTIKVWADKGKIPSARHPISKYRIFIKEELEKFMTDFLSKDSTSSNIEEGHDLIGVKEASEMLGKSHQTIINWMDKGIIEYKRIGTTYILKKEGVQALKEEVENGKKIPRKRNSIKSRFGLLSSRIDSIDNRLNDLSDQVGDILKMLQTKKPDTDRANAIYLKQVTQ